MTIPSAKPVNDRLSARDSFEATIPGGLEAATDAVGSDKLASDAVAGSAKAELTLGEVLAAARAAQQMPKSPGRLKAWRAAWPKW
ncbi:hypothetical protein GCM10007907_24760 [Chitinimonas prasina]|uniref:Uncharacterized protein n=1 Tax=Chitinimonas prasina TaxID=1434937 RepID=A0ABQ5YFB3_9NEIS|nr:hypothetical protein GCM10007907_24760 [Chitinimonas prasina]